MKKSFVHIVLLTLGILFGSCSKHYPDEPKPNGLPTTRLWVSSDTSSTLGETFSRQHLYWYGEDPDGRVVGYLLAVGNYTPVLKRLPSPDMLRYVWTTKTDSIVALPLLQKRDTFTVVVRAVDNHFESASIPNGTQIRLFPQPYWDKDTNGVFSGGDISLPTLPGAVDPKGAIQPFPIRNTPPRVQFAANPVDSATIEEPETTYTVASFSWVGTDDDGNNTIVSYRIALNDTTTPNSWFTLNGTTNLITLSVPRSVSDAASDTVSADVYTGTFPSLQYKGKISGLRLDKLNVLFLQAKDIAGEYSLARTMPSTAKKWYVKKPKSRMLGVVDFSDQRLDKNDITKFYRNVLSDNSILDGQLGSFDVLDIGYGLTDNDKKFQTINQKYGSYVPAAMNPAFILTLKLFDVVFWFSDLSPSIKPAQVGLFNYTLGGGKVIFSTTFASSLVYGDIRALNDFAPLDSITSDAVSTTQDSTNVESRIPVGTYVQPFNPSDGYPSLAFDSLDVKGQPMAGLYHNLTMRRVYKRADSKYIYQLEPAKGGARYKGTPDVAVIDNAKRFVLIALPLHLLNGKQRNLSAFFRKVIVDEFGIR
jgi:hypothetical protein